MSDENTTKKINRYKQAMNIMGAALSVIGLSHVINDVYDGLIVWHGFLAHIDHVYVIVRNAVQAFLVGWWAPGWPTWLSDLLLVFMVASTAYVSDEHTLLTSYIAIALSIVFPVFNPNSPIKDTDPWWRNAISYLLCMSLVICVLLPTAVLVLIIVSINLVRYALMVAIVKLGDMLGRQWLTGFRASEAYVSGVRALRYAIALALLLLLNYQVLRRFYPQALAGA